MWLIPLVSALVTVVWMTLLPNTRSREILKKDNWGLVALTVGLVGIGLGFNLNLVGWAKVWILTVGGFLAGFGGLVALPDSVTDVVTNQENVFYVALILGIGLLALWGWNMNQLLGGAIRRALATVKVADWVWWSLYGGLALLVPAAGWKLYKSLHP